MKCKETQEQEKTNLQLRNKKKVQKLKEKGITLIALVVTIIILLILAGVTLNMAMSGDGLFSRARNAADKYKKAQEDEVKLISEIGKEMNSEYVGAYVEGYELTEGKCTITGEQSGIGENQTFTTVEEGEIKWRIWDYDGTILRIILDRPTTQELTLKGVDGYNNGVWAINEICRKCFGQYEDNNNNGTMKAGISVANLRISDIQNVSSYDYKEYSHKSGEEKEAINEEDTIKFGESKTYNIDYPNIWKLNDKNWSYEYKEKIVTEEDKEYLIWEKEVTNDGTLKGYSQSNGMVTFKQSNYYHDYYNKENEMKNEKYYDLIFTGNKDDKNKGWRFWLAGRSVHLNDEEPKFGIWNIFTKEGIRLISSFGLKPDER